jgi:putative ABC transport system permease protein
LIFGIALGVSGVIAIDIAKVSVSKSFELSTAVLTRKTTHQITGADFTVPQSLFVQLRRVLGLHRTAPIIERAVTVPELAGRTFTFMGIDPFSETHFRDIRFAAGSEGTSRKGGDPRSVMTRGDGVILSGSLASDYGMGIDSNLTLTFGGRGISTRIGALLAPGDAGPAFDGVILADIALTQEILGLGDRISRIDLILSSDAEADRVRERLPPGLTLTETDDRNQTIRSLSRSFETSLTAFSMLVLFMGIFLIYNTVSFSVARRRGLNGTLRALGATRREIFISVQAEVLVYALAGSAIGVVLGILLGKGAVQAVIATVSDMYYTLTVSRTHIAPVILLKGAIVGILAAVGSSLMPAVNAANTRPVTLMQRSASESSLTGMLPGLTLGGLVAGAAALIIFNWPGASINLVFAGVFLVFTGGSLLAPLLVALLTRGTDAALRLIPGRFRLMSGMAMRNVRRSLSRTSVLIASLMVVVSVYIGIDTMTRSFRLSIVHWVDGHIGGDVHVESLDALNRSLDKTLPDKISAIPGVRDISAYNIHRVFSAASGEVHIFSYLRDLSEKEWTWRSPGVENNGDVDRMLNEGWIIVSEIFARQNGFSPKSDGEIIVTMDTLQGPQNFRVAGIFRDFFMGGGRVVVSRSIMKTFWGHDDITAMQIFVRGTSPEGKEAVISRVMQKLRSFETTNGGDNNPPLLRIRSGLDIKQSILAAFDKTFLITSALQVLTAIVALTGIINSVMALILERARELGILRACGALPSQVRTLVLWECAASGFLAGLLALPLGIFLSWVLVYVVNYRSFGWTYDMQLSVATMIQAVAFSGMAALVAGLVPAFRAGGVDIGKALRTE